MDNFDPNSLQGLLAQFQPSASDKAEARRMALLTASLGLLGTRRGFEFQGLGNAGLLGVQTYQNTLKNEQAQRVQNLQAATAMQGLMRQQALMKTAADIMNND